MNNLTLEDRLNNEARSYVREVRAFLWLKAQIKSKKKAVIFYPDFVVMTLEQYRSMTKKENQ